MSTKTKKTNPNFEKLTNAAEQLGIFLMTAAALAGMLELPNRPNSRVIIPNQPSFAFAGDQNEDENNNTLRREQEETSPHYISYSLTQRTPARSGRR